MAAGVCSGPVAVEFSVGLQQIREGGRRRHARRIAGEHAPASRVLHSDNRTDVAENSERSGALIDIGRGLSSSNTGRHKHGERGREALRRTPLETRHIGQGTAAATYKAQQRPRKARHSVCHTPEISTDHTQVQKEARCKRVL
ncbi:unnamed protein product [Urochloa humidicola]